MSGILFASAVFAILIVAGLIFIMKKKQEIKEEKPDSSYVCTYCGESDCECHKLEPDA